MISEKDLKKEIKRMPKLIKRAAREGDYIAAIRLQEQMFTMSWVLEFNHD